MHLSQYFLPLIFFLLVKSTVVFVIHSTGDHSFMHGCFPIQIQYLTSVLGRILLNLVVMVMAFGARGHWFEPCPDLIFLPCICFFLCYGLRS